MSKEIKTVKKNGVEMVTRVGYIPLDTAIWMVRNGVKFSPFFATCSKALVEDRLKFDPVSNQLTVKIMEEGKESWIRII